MYGGIVWFYRYWYIEYLLFWYILFWILKRFIPDFSDWLLLLLAISSFFLFSNIKSEQSLSFICGVLYSAKKDKISGNKYQYEIVALFLLIFGITCLAAKQSDFIRCFGEESLAVKLCQLGIKLPVGLSILLFYSQIRLKSTIKKVCSFLGVISLEIYLVQMPLYSYISSSVIRLIVVIFMISILVFVLNYSARFLIKRLIM